MLPDFSDFPSFPKYEADWAPIYLEPIVQSGERLTIAVVAKSSTGVDGCLAISDKALKCLYGASAAGMQKMMELALNRALEFAETGFEGSFSAGIHGISVGKTRKGLGVNMKHILQQACSLTSSLSSVHSDAIEEEDAEDDPIVYEQNLGQLRSDIQERVLGTLPGLRDRFNLPLHTQAMQGARGNLFFSGNKMVASLAKIKPSNHISRHVDGAKSRLWDLHFVKHKMADAPQNKCTLFIWTPKSLDRFDRALINEYEQCLEDLQRQSLEDGIEPQVFFGAEEAAEAIIDYERAA